VPTIASSFFRESVRSFADRLTGIRLVLWRWLDMPEARQVRRQPHRLATQMRSEIRAASAASQLATTSPAIAVTPDRTPSVAVAD
jgi:hypothetical protein